MRTKSIQPKKDYLETVKALVFKILKGQPVRVYLFGSWSKGKAQVISDIDVGILPLKPLPTTLMSRLRETLEESHIPFVVDLVDLTTANPSLRNRVLNEGILWKD